MVLDYPRVIMEISTDIHAKTAPFDNYGILTKLVRRSNTRAHNTDAKNLR